MYSIGINIIGMGQSIKTHETRKYHALGGHTELGLYGLIKLSRPGFCNVLAFEVWGLVLYTCNQDNKTTNSRLTITRIVELEKVFFCTDLFMALSSHRILP